MFMSLHQDTAAGHCGVNNTVYNVKLLLLSPHLMLRNSLLLPRSQQQKLKVDDGVLPYSMSLAIQRSLLFMFRLGALLFEQVAKVI